MRAQYINSILRLMPQAQGWTTIRSLSRGVRTGVTRLDESFDWLACPPTYIQSDPPGDGVPYNPWPLKSN
jgi:hypothetical protein